MEAIEPIEILASNRESCRKRIGMSLDGYSKRGENIVALEWRCGSGFIICAGDLQSTVSTTLALKDEHNVFLSIVDKFYKICFITILS